MSTKCLFSDPEDGLRMGCLGSEPGARQGVWRGGGKQASEAGTKKLCLTLLQRSLTANEILLI